MSCGNTGDRSDGPAQADINNEAPYGPGAKVGEAFDYVLYTHCGIKWARIDGMWWQTTPLDDGNANPPPGWDNPYDTGRLLVIDKDTATYTGGSDTEIKFKRTDLVKAPVNCA